MTTQALKRAVEQGERGVQGVSAKHGPAAARWRECEGRHVTNCLKEHEILKNPHIKKQ